MDAKIKNLYKEYKNGVIDRRSFLGKLTIFAGGTAAAISLLPTLEKNQAYAAVPAGGPADLHTEVIEYPTGKGIMQAYLARPLVDKKLPAVIVIHENKGLQPHILDVTRRMAQEGFVALGPDALSPLGGTPENNVDKARTLMRELNYESTTNDFVAAVE